MEFRGAGGAVRVAGHPVGERFQPILGNLDVRVYEHEIFKISGVRQLAYSLEGPVVATGEAVVLVQADLDRKSVV